MNSPAAQTKGRMRKRTECTGFLARITAKADTTRSGARIQKNKASACIVRLLSQSPRPDRLSLHGNRQKHNQRNRWSRGRHCGEALVGLSKTPVDTARHSTGQDHPPLFRREIALSI